MRPGRGEVGYDGGGAHRVLHIDRAVPSWLLDQTASALETAMYAVIDVVFATDIAVSSRTTFVDEVGNLFSPSSLVPFKTRVGGNCGLTMWTSTACTTYHQRTRERGRGGERRD